MDGSRNGVTPGTERGLSGAERDELLGVARRTLSEFLAVRRTPVVDNVSRPLLERRGAFVTLHKGRSLRGCIGTFDASDPLLSTVQRMAIAAATSDPRFPPVTADELDDLHLEISVLSPLRRVRADEVEVGVHGVYITRGMFRGVLLPQVATEHGWDRETFLEHTCIKAGLSPDAWRDPETRIEVFNAEVFAEHPRPAL
jgi:AmmeMemoRadiSam system protein A